jgi:hypothetical protein
MKASSRPGFLALLWTVVLLAPFAWMVALGSMLPMTDWVCARGARGALIVVGGICLALAVAAIAIGWMRLPPGRTPGNAESASGVAEERSRFMLGLGIGMSAIIALVIAMYIVPVFLLSSCPT